MEQPLNTNTNTQNLPVPCPENQVVKKYFTAWLVLFLSPVILAILTGINNFGLRLLLGNNEAIISLNNTIESITMFLSIVSSIAGHIVIIVGKSKCKNDKSINIAFWVDMVFLILSVLAAIAFTVLFIVGVTMLANTLPELINENTETFTEFLHNFS